MSKVVEFPVARAIDAEAAKWLIKMDSESGLTQEERRAFSDCLHRSPACQEGLISLASLWGKMNVLTELAVPLVKPTQDTESHVAQTVFTHIAGLFVTTSAVLTLVVGVVYLWFKGVQ